MSMHARPTSMLCILKNPYICLCVCTIVHAHMSEAREKRGSGPLRPRALQCPSPVPSHHAQSSGTNTSSVLRPV